MNSKRKILPLILGVTALLICLAATSCKGRTKGDGAKEKDENISADEQTMEQIKSAEKVFNALPTPLEVAQLIKEAGATRGGINDYFNAIFRQPFGDMLNLTLDFWRRLRTLEPLRGLQGSKKR